MRTPRIHPTSLLTALALIALAVVAGGQKSDPPKAHFEYRIVDDPTTEVVNELARDGWEYAGYLGLGVRGSNNDETLWKRAVH